MKNTSQRKINRSMPPGVVIPELPYPDVRQAVDWLCQSFGFKERLQIGNHRAQLVFGEGSLIVTHRPAALDSTASAKPITSVMVRVTDIDSHFERARLSGARIINPPTDYPYGERQYTAEDIGGYLWTFSQTIADIDPSNWGGSLIE